MQNSRIEKELLGREIYQNLSKPFNYLFKFWFFALISYDLCGHFEYHES